MRSCLVYFFLLLAICSCDPGFSGDDDILKPISLSPEDLPEEVIYVRDSDVEVLPAFSWDMHTDGEFSYTEGSILGLLGENRFFLSGERFSTMIDFACANSKVNGIEMCRSFASDCDFSDFYLNGAWDLIGQAKTPNYFEWEFIDLKKTKKFVLKFDQLPKPARIVDYNVELSLSELNTIRFQKEVDSDSVFFQLVVIPKSNLKPENQRDFGTIAYRNLPVDNSFIIHGEDLFLFSQRKPTASDSVLINVVTVKRIVKEINDELIGFTYYVNDPKPVVLR